VKDSEALGIEDRMDASKSFNEVEKQRVIDRYSARFDEHGYSQESLGWGPKGRQELRFEVLSSYWDFAGKHVLDLGAGFGDLFRFLEPRGIARYTGIELTPCLVEEGRGKFGGDDRFELVEGDVTDRSSLPSCDIVLISGLFNFRLTDADNYDFIRDLLGTAFLLASDGVAANFITDRVDYTEELIFNANPEQILDIGLGLTKRLIMRMDYMPFEYTMFLDAAQSFDPGTAVFDGRHPDG
jgi:SAM-dependent methyltransferase